MTRHRELQGAEQTNTDSRHPRRTGVWIGAYVVGLLAIHIAWGLWESEFVVIKDGAEYVQMAENLRHLGRLTIDGIEPVVGKPPGLPFLIALYEGVVGSLSGFHVLQLLALFAAYVFLALIIRDNLGLIPAGAVLAFLVAMDPLRLPASNALTEPVFLCLTAMGMWSALQVRRESWRLHAVMAGAAFACSTYFRPVNLFWPLALVLLALFLKQTPRRAWFVLLGVYVILVAPWVVRNSLVMKRPVPMVANWGPLYGMSDEALWRTFWRHSWGGIFNEHGYAEMLNHQSPFNPKSADTLMALARSNIKSDFAGYLGRCAKQFARIWTFVPGTRQWEWRAPTWFWIGRGVMAAFYVACVRGLAALWRKRRWLALVCVTYAVYTAAIHFPITTESHYLIGAYFGLLPLVTAGLMRVAGRLPRE